MRNPVRTKTRITAIKHPFVVKGLMVLFLLCIFIKAVSSMLSASLSDSHVLQLLQDGKVTGGILSFELGSPDGARISSLMARLFPSYEPVSSYFDPFLSSYEPIISSSDSYQAAENNTVDDGVDASQEITKNNGSLFYGGEPATENEAVTQPGSDINEGTTTHVRSAAGITLDNTTEHAVDIQALLDETLDIKLTEGKPAVLIIHTHTSEAFTPAGSDTYTESDPFRTEDKSKNIARVGDELAAELEKRGIGVIHDRRSYDYPSYTGSYNRTYSSVKAYMEKYPSIQLVIDLHRDSITASDGSQYKTMAQIGDVTCSQVMFVVGSDAAGLEHPTWRSNLKLALHLQSEMNTLYPTLARPVRISQYRYNQQLTPGSLILEVGCAGNTLEESLTAVRYFADAAANVMLGLYE